MQLLRNVHCALLEKFLVVVARGKAGIVRRAAATDAGTDRSSTRHGANGRMAAARDIVDGLRIYKGS